MGQHARDYLGDLSHLRPRRHRGVTQIRRLSRAEDHALLYSAGASRGHDNPCVSDYRRKIESGIRSVL
jgi:hypothetical protein